jgi:hypothetical protein
MTGDADSIRRLSRNDGEHIRLVNAGCCATAELIVTPLAQLDVLHDDDCPSLDPAHPRYVAARAGCGRAVAAAYAAVSGQPAMAVLADRTGHVGAATLASPEHQP